MAARPGEENVATLYVQQAPVTTVPLTDERTASETFTISMPLPT